MSWKGLNSWNKEVPSEVGVRLFSNPYCCSRFLSCVLESETSDEFEGRWMAVTQRILTWKWLNS